ncbi:glycoside hydrolase family 16 protein [Thermothelomyces thermophilus ATCC 42464]|uniref:Glycoside hydrolase family 16 protein n=1 Tax=Thermothelomyces thermophilus (strain ATCC 42464 / BCRC 31852 / DSM 1799) TaxID=573729 RepID=G2QE18_THET4|nr:glycoside hydrolase family 16 protein [Thermothelomyces thermophilus ATCC 42464]AEO57601.1 glycoside hydrolase family 16 protein [Thermothelomyces thermophilus ATCC 42464]
MGPIRRILCLPTSLSSLVFFLVSATAPGIAAAGKDPALTDDSQCGCYLNKGNSSTYFTYHRFFDFRSLPQYAGVPAVIQDAESSPDADPTSDYFKRDEWSSFWLLGSWNNSNGARPDATVTMVNSPNNVYIEANTEPDPSSQTYLTLRTQRLSDFQTAAEIESASSGFKYLSLRMRARTVGAAGAITAVFTYRGSDMLADVQESDLEIRTADKRNLVHYTNQPAYTDDGDVVPEATRKATMPHGLDWTAWAIHRLDWTPGLTTWYVDDVEVARIAFQAPRDESNIILNAWSDGGRWTGNMTRFDAAYLQVQWLELLYNSTDPDETKRSRRRQQQDGDGCNAVCSIDETPELGTPVLLWKNGPSQVNGAGGRSVSTGSVPTWGVVVMVLFAMELLI